MNSERPEFRVVEEATFLPSGERKRYVIADGIPFPICSLEECERYKGAMKLDLRGNPSMTVRAFCEEH